MVSSRLYNIIKSPLVTEKTNTIAQANNVVTVAVASDATKPEIKQVHLHVLLVDHGMDDLDGFIAMDASKQLCRTLCTPCA